MDTIQNEYRLTLVNALILIVDDSEENLDFMDSLFSDVGARTIRATNGKDAINILSRYNSKLDLIISDFHMPEMDGLELTRRIREEEGWKQIPIIILSALTSTDTLSLGLEAGANDYLKKPINHIELIARSCSMLRQKRMLESYLELQKMLELKIVERTVEVEMTREAAMFGFAKLAESRDPETGAHLERIREYVKILATHLAKSTSYGDRIDQSFIMNIYKSSPLHDIGKVAISDSILLKPGRLTKEEFETMKTHTMAGAETLRSASERLMGDSFLEMAREIAYCHHERWDGKGYPNGLKGEEIPLSARIMALADVYDALMSKRVYKDALPFSEVDKIIRDGSGTQFDPVVVDAYISVSDELKRIRESHKDEE